LKKCDPDDKLGWRKETALAELERVKVELDKLQQRLYAESKRSLLLVLQARDAAGKDGTIRSIFSGLNPAGVEVTSFKVPLGRETMQDYLWRVHVACPSVWRKRFRHINEFERMLTDEGATIVKCFLNVSKEEQARRFQDRLDDPTKRWKFHAGDLADRELWPKFHHAYEDMMRKTSTSYAPWHVVPADHNWVRNLAVAKILLEHLQAMNPKFPAPEPGIEKIEIV
jgi:polyphosphate kinase 2 (PPK2 family)